MRYINITIISSNLNGESIADDGIEPLTAMKTPPPLVYLSFYLEKNLRNINQEPYFITAEDFKIGRKKINI